MKKQRQWQYNVALWKSNDNDNIIGFMQKRQQRQQRQQQQQQQQRQRRQQRQWQRRQQNMTYITKRQVQVWIFYYKCYYYKPFVLYITGQFHSHRETPAKIKIKVIKMLKIDDSQLVR